MAYVTNRTLTVQSGALTWITATWADLRDRMARRAVYRRTLNELQALNERELNDLGLNRSMLRRIAWQAANKG